MNEFELIRKITNNHIIGDDCAIFDGPDEKSYLITTDGLFEGVHFRKDWTTPQTLGRKALSVNISDIAAMGGKPLSYLVTLGIPKGTPSKEIEAFHEGMAQVAANYRMALIGGDTCSSANGMIISITAIGIIEKNKAIMRSGAKPGDAIFVTGNVGEAATGFACLEKGLASMDVRHFIKRHNDPTPRVNFGAWLSASTCATAMLDVSDGLIQDLSHIAEASFVGIKLAADKILISKDMSDTAALCHKDPLQMALTGGEDYELVFTVSKEKLKLFEKMLTVVLPTFGHPVTCIGEVTEGSGVQVVDMHGQNMIIENGGFEHTF